MVPGCGAWMLLSSPSKSAFAFGPFPLSLGEGRLTGSWLVFVGSLDTRVGFKDPFECAAIVRNASSPSGAGARIAVWWTPHHLCLCGSELCPQRVENLLRT